jgi:hypothetical protein
MRYLSSAEEVTMKQTTSKPFTSNATQGHTFTMQRSAEIVGRAFAPLPCVAATVGFSTRVAFEVTDGKKTIVKGSIPPDLAQKDYNLRNEIMRYRRAVEAQGVKLAPWEIPSA